MILGIDHVAIICSDYDESKTFYTQKLGLPILREIYRAERDSFKLDLELPDGTQLEIFSFPNAPERPSYPEAQGLRHLSFKVKNIDLAVDWLNKKGIETEEVRLDELTQKRFVFFADPDGLPLELYER